MRKSNTKIKILSLFFIVLFIQRVGFSMLVNNYITTHIYKEQPCVKQNTNKHLGKFHNPDITSKCNKIFENDSSFDIVFPNFVIQPLTTYIEKKNEFGTVNYFHSEIFTHKNKLRGPPYYS